MIIAGHTFNLFEMPTSSPVHLMAMGDFDHVMKLWIYVWRREHKRDEHDPHVDIGGEG